LVKYLYFLKEKFYHKNNENEIPKITYKSYELKIKNIKYIVIFDYNQYFLYIYDLQLNKIIDVQKYVILYQVKNLKFKFRFNIPMIKNFYNYCNNFIKK
jgi:hypothetical protein